MDLASLPTEILLAIFVQCLPTTDDYIRKRAFPINKWAPLTIMHICRRWREIAISDSQLWTILYLGSRDMLYEDVCEKIKQMMAVWDERSRGRPLTISLRFKIQVERPRPRKADSFRLHNAAWKSLIPNLSRLLAHCRCLELGRASADIISLVESSQAIEELVILSADGYDDIGSKLPYPQLTPPLLHLQTFKCHLTRISKCICTASIALSKAWSSASLRKLVLQTALDLQGFVFLLTRIPHLEDLQVSVAITVVEQAADASNPSPVFELYLRILSLNATIPLFLRDVSGFQNTLAGLSFPSLQKFAFSVQTSSPSASNEEVLRIVASLLHRSHSPITYLYVGWRYFLNTETIATLLHAVPFLRHLRFYKMHVYSVANIVDALVEQTALPNPLDTLDDGDTLRRSHRTCPLLESITFDAILWRSVGKAAADLTRLVARRCGQGDQDLTGSISKISTLTFIRSEDTDDWVDELYTALTKDSNVERCRQEGLELNVEEMDYSRER